MKRFVFATLSAAVIATLAASSASEAALINFTLATIDGSPTYAGGSTLDQSTSLDFDDAFLVVQEVGATDVSGLSPGEIGAVSVLPTDIDYSATPLSVPVIVSWTGDTGDTFTETLTLVDSINRMTLNQIIVSLSGMVSDTDNLFVDTPALFVVNATQFGGVGTGTSATFTNTAGVVTPTVPEPSTWVMMALGFGALGYAAIHKAHRAAFSS
jgi:PEP-CTERM motif